MKSLINKIRQYDIQEVIEMVLITLALIGTLTLCVFFGKGMILNNKTVHSLKESGYTVQGSQQIAGVYVYYFHDTEHNYIVGQDCIAEYLK